MVIAIQHAKHHTGYTSSIIRRKQSARGRLRTLSQAGVEALILSLWLLGAAWILPSSAVAQQSADGSFISRYNALVQRYTELLYTDGTLSQLRVDITYDHLQLLYNDPRFIYWTHELNSVLQQLASMTGDPCSSNPVTSQCTSFFESLVASMTGDPCFSGHSSTACLVHTAQQIANILAQRNQEIFGNLDTQARFNDWAHRWEEAVHNAEQNARAQCTSGGLILQSLYCTELLSEQGYEEALESLKVEFPAFAQYLQVSQEVATRAATVFANPTVSQTVAQDTQEFATRVQELLDMPDYGVVVEQFQTRLHELLVADQTYQDLQSETQRVATDLNSLRQMIHDTVAYCLQFGYGEQCFAPHFNTGLQAVLPQYNPAHDQVLMDAAELAESANQFWYWFSQSDALRTLQQDYVNTVQATVVAVLPDLQQAQETFKQQVLAIPEVAAQVGDLWNQMAELARALGATN